jgi:hypothetical protein
LRAITYLEQDCLTYRGATVLAKKIERYWHARGHHSVTAWIHEFRYADIPSAQFAVRSNLINGLPPKTYRDAKADACGGLKIGRPRKIRECAEPVVNT